jgi:hypothetical protein
VRRIRLRELPDITLTGEDTVVLPPAVPLKPNLAVRQRLEALDKAAALA